MYHGDCKKEGGVAGRRRGGVSEMKRLGAVAKGEVEGVRERNQRYSGEG